jgi:aspartyl-tRNA(Asn)/glutamyl-tRNA(Gln) amidotransferase subunit A
MTRGAASPGVAATAHAVNTGATTAVDVTRAAMARVVNGESGPSRLNAFTSFAFEDAVEQAEAVDARLAAGAKLPLAGVPIAVKDNICTVRLPTTCGSRLLARYTSPFDATVVRRLRDAGAVVVGKTNLDEFGMGSSTENSAFGPTRNPHDLERVAGGSSGGSAAAVAAGMVPAALGSDTGGSVRQPAAFCGVVGLRPTWGRVSRYGLVAYASSLDQVGVIGRHVADAALLLDVIAGADPLDMTASRRAVPGYGAAAAGPGQGTPTGPGQGTPAAGHPAGRGAPLQDVVIGVPGEYLVGDIDAGVRAVFDEAVERLRSLGATLRTVSLPHTACALPAYYVLAPAEASANLARFDGVRFGSRATRGAARTAAGALAAATRAAGFGTEVKRRIILGSFALSGGYHDDYYVTAQRVRTLVARDFGVAFDEGFDLLFTPTTPTTAFLAGAKADDPYAMYQSDVFTIPAALAGLPALSLPIGAADGLPVGGQFIGPRWAEPAVIAAAAALERMAVP